MESNVTVWQFLAVLMVCSCTSGDSDAKKFPLCININSAICTPGLCTSVNIIEDFNSTLSSPLQGITNVLCANNTPRSEPQGTSALASSTYLLTGCPRDDYFAPTQSTSGICFASRMQATEAGLYLTVSRMVAGLHSFTCLTSESPPFLESYVIVVNDTALFRDIQVYINGRQSQKTASVSLTEGEVVTITVRAVGNVNLIKLNATNPVYGINATERFKVTCVTEFICNKEFTGLSRYQQCCFHARLNDNATTIKFLIDYMGETVELGEVNITVNPTRTTGVTPEPTMSPSENGSEADDGIATIIIVVIIIPLFILAVTIVPVSKAVKRRCNKTNHHKQSTIPLEFDYQVLVGSFCSMEPNVLVYCCNHFPLDSLISKLEQKEGFVIENLADDSSCQLSDYISDLTLKLTNGAVLLDCSCPLAHRSDLHKAVKQFTLIPFTSSESKKWKVFQLVHTDDEVQSLSWSSELLDCVNVMYYNELDDRVAAAVVTELEKHLRSRKASSSINSKNSGAHVICEEMREIVARVEEKAIDLSAQLAKNYEETRKAICDVSENIELTQRRQSPIMHDVRKLVEHNEEK